LLWPAQKIAFFRISVSSFGSVAMSISHRWLSRLDCCEIEKMILS
jgi:hypothetical protein